MMTSFPPWKSGDNGSPFVGSEEGSIGLTLVSIRVVEGQGERFMRNESVQAGSTL